MYSMIQNPACEKYGLSDLEELPGSRDIASTRTVVPLRTGISLNVNLEFTKNFTKSEFLTWS